MTVLDRPAVVRGAPGLDRHTRDEPSVGGRRYMRIACVVAELLIAAHMIDALLQQGPPTWTLRAGWLALTLVVAAIGVLSLLRLAQIPAALLALTLGTGAAVEGFGIGVAHTIKGAASGPDGTGLASAAAGVLLVVLGAVLIVSHLRAWWRLLGIPIGLAYVAYGVVPLTMAVNITHSNPGALSGRTPADAGLVFYDVVVPTRDEPSCRDGTSHRAMAPR